MKECRKKLHDIVDSLDRQDIPQLLKTKSWNEQKKKVLNAYLTIDLQIERGNFSEGLIRIKSLTEFILEDFIKDRYPGLLDTYTNASEKKYLGLWDYNNILEDENEKDLCEKIEKVKSINSTRNTVAHKLDPIKAKELKQLDTVFKTLKDLVKEHYQLREKDFDFYKEQNKELLELLK